MSNPFLEPRSLLFDRERKLRQRFELGLYLTLGTMCVLLSGSLIEGCQRTQLAGVARAEYNDSTNLVQAAFGNERALGTNVSAAVARTNVQTVIAPSLLEGARQPPVSSPEGANVSYVIKPGDTLGRIAKGHHTTVAALKSANGLKSDQIIAGHQLNLPAPHDSIAATFAP